ADQRHQLAAPPGYRGAGRRREIPAHHRGRALLQVARQRSRRHGARARRLHHRLGGSGVPLMNSFFGGPTIVRGFAPNGFGPRDLTPGSTMDNVGGSMYWATSAELQS